LLFWSSFKEVVGNGAIISGKIYSMKIFVVGNHGYSIFFERCENNRNIELRKAHHPEGWQIGSNKGNEKKTACRRYATGIGFGCIPDGMRGLFGQLGFYRYCIPDGMEACAKVAGYHRNHWLGMTEILEYI